MNPAQPRLPYRKPTIERITLAGEETAAVPNCKRDTGGGKSQTYPNPCRTDWWWDIFSARCRDTRGS
jgi:hypothetical protein